MIKRQWTVVPIDRLLFVAKLIQSHVKENINTVTRHIVKEHRYIETFRKQNSLFWHLENKYKPANQNKHQLVDRILWICLCALKMRTQERNINEPPQSGGKLEGNAWTRSSGFSVSGHMIWGTSQLWKHKLELVGTFGSLHVQNLIYENKRLVSQQTS